MRTTLDLNDALLRRAKAEAARRGTTLTRLIEEGLALRLEQAEAPAGPRPPFAWKVFEGRGGVRPGVDLTSNESIYLASELDYDRRKAGLVDDDTPCAGEDDPT